MPVSGAVQASDDLADAVTVDPLEELEVVWVHGKSLANRITDAEDEFFALYNKVNRNNKFDVRCGYMSLTRDSMIMVRTCVPQFLANYSRGASGFTINTVPRFASTFGGYDGYGSSYGYSGRGYDIHGNNSYNYGSYGYVSGRNYAYAPPPDLMAMHYRQDYAKNVIDVIYSDPGLLEKAKGLAVLYKEMETMQGRYRELRKITRKKPNNDLAKARKAARRGMDRTGG
jgi:hypothetical protein